MSPVWQAAPPPAGGGGGGMALPLAMVSGRWYGPETTFPYGAPSSSWTPTAGILVHVPMFVPFAVTVSALATAVATTGVGQAYRLGVYACDPPTGRPGALLLDAGEVDGAAATGIKSVTGLALVLPGGAWCFLSVWAKLGTGTLTGFSATNVRMPNTYGVLTANDTTVNPFPAQIAAYGGALPDPAGSGAGVGAAPAPLLRVLIA